MIDYPPRVVNTRKGYPDDGTIVLRVEHPVSDFEAWKRDGFDRDPIGRKRSGVRAHRVLRADGASSTVAVVELEFATRAEAESFATRLDEMWRRVQHRFGWRQLPQARLYEVTDAQSYR